MKIAAPLPIDIDMMKNNKIIICSNRSTSPDQAALQSERPRSWAPFRGILRSWDWELCFCCVFLLRNVNIYPPRSFFCTNCKNSALSVKGRRPLHALVFFRLSSKLICRCSQVVEFVEAFHCKFHTIVVTEFLAGENWFQRVKGATETLNEILRVMMKTLLSLQPMVASGQPLMYRPTRIIGNRLFLS